MSLALAVSLGFLFGFVVGHFVAVPVGSMAWGGWLYYDHQQHPRPPLEDNLGTFGQIEIGLATQEKRTSAATRAFEFAAGAQGASGKKSQQSSQSVEVEVKPTTADRFYELLPRLIEGRSKNPSRPWLHDLSGEAGKHYNLAKQAEALCTVREGDFVRIENAHLYLPRYAAILSKVRYAQKVVSPQLRPSRAVSQRSVRVRTRPRHLPSNQRSRPISAG